MEHPNLKWMRTGGSPIVRKPLDSTLGLDGIQNRDLVASGSPSCPNLWVQIARNGLTTINLIRRASAKRLHSELEIHHLIGKSTINGNFH